MVFSDLFNRKNQEEPEIYYNEQGIRIPRPEVQIPKDPEQKEILNRILNSRKLYCLFSLFTGDPYVFGTLRQCGREFAMGPFYIALWDIVPQAIPGTEVKEISGDFHMIHNFLGSCFYLNGVQGVRFNGGDWIIPREKLVEKPDFSDLPYVRRPITNEELVLFMLLVSQMSGTQGEDPDLIYQMYLKKFAAYLKDARVLVPMKVLESMKDSPNGRTELQKDTKFTLAIRKQTAGRDLAEVYTDNQRLHRVMDMDWGGMIQPFSQVIKVYDCQLNQRPGYPRMGFYLNREKYDQLMEMLK